MSPKLSKSSVEIDVSEFTKEQLITIIQQSCDQDVSVNKIIEQYIEEFLKAHSES